MKDLYYLLSLEFYGTEEQHNRILNIICRFELEADNVEFFCKFDDSSVTNETRFTDKKKILKTNVERVQNQPKSSADCELYALSSVFHVDIIVDKTGNGNWETYMSVVCTYAGFFYSPIILYRQRATFIPYVTPPGECSCRQSIPNIQGHIGKIRENIHKAVCTYKTPILSLREINTRCMKLLDKIQGFCTINLIHITRKYRVIAGWTK